MKLSDLNKIIRILKKQGYDVQKIRFTDFEY